MRKKKIIFVVLGLGTQMLHKLLIHLAHKDYLLIARDKMVYGSLYQQFAKKKSIQSNFLPQFLLEKLAHLVKDMCLTETYSQKPQDRSRLLLRCPSLL